MQVAQELELPAGTEVQEDDAERPGEGVGCETLDECSYGRFFSEYLVRNRACVVRGASVGWACAERWVVGGGVDCARLAAECGRLSAPVADCKARPVDAQCKTEMPVSEFVAYLSGADGARAAGRLLYLKDWHLRRARPQDAFYSVPSVFASDWLNEYALDEDEDDFMFVYIGPAGSWSPLHVDVYSSYSWSVNVVGRKRWLLFPPGEESKLKDSGGKLPLDCEPVLREDVECFEVIQEAGDAIFVPSGWHHQVSNLLDTISINHNWINGCNVGRVWSALRHNLSLVQKEIEELRGSEDYERQCQLVLRAYYGMNYEGFIKFLLHIARKRLSQAMGERHLSFGKYLLGMRHVKFDLCAISEVIQDMLQDEALVKEMNYVDFQNAVSEIKRNIEIKLGDSTF